MYTPFYFNNVVPEFDFCGVETGERRGVIRSPNYPSNYPNNINCNFTLITPQDVSAEIRLQIISIDVEGCCDKVYAWTSGSRNREELGIREPGHVYTCRSKLKDTVQKEK